MEKLQTTKDRKVLNISELRKTGHYTPWKILREGMERGATFVNKVKKK